MRIGRISKLFRTIWNRSSEMDYRNGWRRKSSVGAVQTAARLIRAEQLASYAGTVPTVKSSGGKVRYGHTCKESNHYLKWACVEAANAPAQYRMHPRWQHRHLTHLYERVSLRKGHSVAVGAVARHLAEAAFWILNKKEPYREPTRQRVLPKLA